MSTLRSALALIALAALAACGGGGSGTATPAVPSASKSAPQTLNAKASVTLRLPLHFAIAKTRTKTTAKKRSPAYINPSASDSFVIQLNGQAINDPNNPSNAYFGMGTQDLSSGTSVLTVPITSGYIGDGSLYINEYDDSCGGGCGGTLIAQGTNGPYTDSNGNYQDGSINVTPGGTTALTVTMNMDNNYIVLTTDPVSGSDAEAITYYGETFCANPGSPLYAFSADDSFGYVLPGSPAGYAGGDSNNYAYPGIPAVSLQNQYTENTGGTTSSLVSGAFGWNFVYDGSNGIFATFYASNALYGYGNYAYVDIEPLSQCG